MQRIERTIPSGDRRTIQRRVGKLPAMFIALLAMVTIASCDQSSIFYDISNETKPKDPIIPGSPSNMVMFPAGSSKMWISNGRLYMFDGSGWSHQTGPTGTVRSLAVAGSFMYALTIDGGDGTRTHVWRTSDGASWTELTLSASVSSYSLLESIYAAGPAGTETLFVGAHIPAGEADLVTAYGILYVNGTTLESVKVGLNPTDAAGALVGAAYDGSTYYLATTKAGILASSSAASGYSELGGVAADKSFLLSGITAIGGTVVAAGRGEHILYGNSTSGFTAKKFSDIMFIGGMATWDETGDGTPDLLILPIDDNDSSYTYGYREIALTGGAFPADPFIKAPGNGTPTTVADEDQYDSSLGRKAVRHLFQYNSGGTRVLFASSYTDGLRSYRDDEWNAED